jgi:hypothetical protein
VKSDSSRSTEITSTQFPWEREALHYLRERLSDHDPIRSSPTKIVSSPSMT